MKTYLMPHAYGEAEFIEKRSRFIGRVWPVETEEEALAHLRETREKHWDATHNVYAYIIRDTGVMRYSDDGEPGGTSGMPTLNVFRSGEITNVLCVVTRYFGGILLGAGGLVRAYSNTAKLALDAAGVAQMAQWRQYTIGCAYNLYERVKRLLDAWDCVVEGSDFGTDVTIDLLIRDDRAEEFCKALEDLTNGTAVWMETGGCFRGVKIR
jgi:uncharacterized YigZ family protein